MCVCARHVWSSSGKKPARRFACCAKSLKKQENKKEKDFHADGASHTDTASLSLSLFKLYTHLHVRTSNSSRTVYTKMMCTGRRYLHMFLIIFSLSPIIRLTTFFFVLFSLCYIRVGGGLRSGEFGC